LEAIGVLPPHLPADGPRIGAGSKDTLLERCDGGALRVEVAPTRQLLHIQDGAYIYVVLMP